jgi:DNA polymerase
MNKQTELSKIAKEIEQCELCKAWGTGKAVPGEGDPDADIVFLGEAPGKDEAETGRPFVGRSGKFLRAMIKEIGLKEENVYITSPVKYLPQSGTPVRENIIHSRIHLSKQLSVIDPKILVLLGSIACIAVLDQAVSITKEHGKTISRDGKIYFITYHPAAGLRFPETKEKFIDDFNKLKKLIRSKSAVSR